MIPSGVSASESPKAPVDDDEMVLEDIDFDEIIEDEDDMSMEIGVEEQPELAGEASDVSVRSNDIDADDPSIEIDIDV